MYGFTPALTGLSFDDALAKTTAALKAEGFGALSDIDLRRAMKEKLGADMLPCNVIVRGEAPGCVVVGFLDPQTMVGLVGRPGVKAVADEAENRLRRAFAALGGETSRTV